MSKSVNNPNALPSETPVALSRRKRQIMDIIYASGRADVQEVLDRMADAPSYSAVRATMNVLVSDGLLRCEKESRRYIYLPVQPHESAAQAAAKRVLMTFFGGSVSRAMAGLLDAADRDLSSQELEELSRLVRENRKRGKP